MRFTVLGKSPAWQDAGGACSGYLVREGDYTLLIDAGNGVFAKLREQVAYTVVDQVLISHLHADHVLDLIPFSFALTLGPRDLPGSGAAPRAPAKPGLLLPPGAARGLRQIVGIGFGDEGLLDEAFELGEYTLDAELGLGPLSARMHQVPHYVLTHAVELIAPSGERLVYGADCRFSEALIDAARDAAVLLAEATLPEPEPETVPESERGHMSPLEAGELAARAGVGRLVLTHISDQLDPGAALAAAGERFDGPIEIAATGSGWEL